MASLKNTLLVICFWKYATNGARHCAAPTATATAAAPRARGRPRGPRGLRRDGESDPAQAQAQARAGSRMLDGVRLWRTPTAEWEAWTELEVLARVPLATL